MIEFQNFNSEISYINSPKFFTFPFYYNPHDLSIIAMKELQDELIHSKSISHNFGLNETNKALPVIGKMFGVLIVKDSKQNIGYLKAYSGQLQDDAHLEGFVPPIISINYEKQVEKTKKEVEKINQKIHAIEINKEYQDVIYQKVETIKSYSKKLTDLKKKNTREKENRKIKREEIENLPQEKKKIIMQELAKESSKQKKQLKALRQEEQTKLLAIEKKIALFNTQIKELKDYRVLILANLQTNYEKDLFFNNMNGDLLSLHDIFKKYHTKKPNVGTGECCAPKLLNFAFNNNLTPIAMSEFWWGAPHKNNIRRHKNIYPACTGRCAPLLKHMLIGLPLEENPIKINYGEFTTIEKLYEDDGLLVINKPAGLLSTPGTFIKDSVQTRLKEEYDHLEYIMPIHRLDQGTSGVIIVAKNRKIHALMQKLFLKKTINKTYEAILVGKINSMEGTINLALSPDSNNPPFHMINKKNGKPSQTHYHVLKTNESHSLVELKPITGRTHQLRLHCAHQDGLNAPILGDDMYGIKDSRMYLHASSIDFIHPISKLRLCIKSASKFNLTQPAD